MGSATAPDRLVEPSAELGTEAKRQRRARLRQEVADPLEAEHAQIVGHGGWQAQRFQRQGGDDRRTMSGCCDETRLREIASEGVRSAPTVGDGCARGDAGHGNAPDQRIEHRLFAAVKVIRARGVDHDTVGAVHRNDRGKALQDP